MFVPILGYDYDALLRLGKGVEDRVVLFATQTKASTATIYNCTRGE